MRTRLAEANQNAESVNAAYEAMAKKELSFYLAAFLIGAQPYSYLQYGWGWVLHSGPLVEYPEFKKKLGMPLADYTRATPDGWIFQREFEHASVWVDLNEREGEDRMEMNLETARRRAGIRTRRRPSPLDSKGTGLNEDFQMLVFN